MSTTVALMAGGWFLTAVLACMFWLDRGRSDRMVEHYRAKWREAAARKARP